MTLFSCKDLTLGYDGRAVAENLNFEAEKGDYLCIIGENGYQDAFGLEQAAFGRN